MHFYDPQHVGYRAGTQLRRARRPRAHWGGGILKHGQFPNAYFYRNSSLWAEEPRVPRSEDSEREGQRAGRTAGGKDSRWEGQQALPWGSETLARLRLPRLIIGPPAAAVCSAATARRTQNVLTTSLECSVNLTTPARQQKNSENVLRLTGRLLFKAQNQISTGDCLPSVTAKNTLQPSNTKKGLDNKTLESLNFNCYSGETPQRKSFEKPHKIHTPHLEILN